MTTPFDQLERALWAPPEKLTVSEWSDRYRRLPATDPKPGPWRTEFTPYWREPLDAYGDPTVEEIVIVAGAQTGKSRCLENMVGYAVCVDPIDMLLVVARDRDVRDVVRGRLKPMIDDSPSIRAQLSENAQEVGLEAMRFRRCAVYLAASNSPAGLASKSCGTVLLDEIGKWPKSIRNEGNPVDLARQRTNAFAGRRKVVAVSSPTTEKHGIHPEFLRTDRRRYHVPCPDCGHWQTLRWSQVKYQGRDAEAILADHSLVHYECEDCAAPWTDADKRAAVSAGVWVPDGAEVTPDGEVIGGRASVARGYHVSGLLSPIRPLADFVARWLRAQGDRSKLAVFFRSDLGEPWQDVETTIDADDVAQMRGDYQLGELPEECPAAYAFAGIDVGERVVHWVVRAFAPGMESWLVERGLAVKIEEAVATVLGTDWGIPLRRACVDSGYRTHEVYRICAEHRGRLVPVKGRAVLEPGDPVKATAVDRKASGQIRRRGVTLRSLDTSFFKDALTSLQEQERWHLPADIDDDYLEQLASESKVVDDDGRERWEPRTPGAANHYLDAEVYALAAAHIEGLWRGGAAARHARPRVESSPRSAAPAAERSTRPAGAASDLERRIRDVGGGGRGGIGGRRALGAKRPKAFGGRR